jgi:hypothetical protein
MARVLLLLLVATGCGDGPAVLVDLRTDYVPGIEFDSVEVGLTPAGAATEMSITSGAAMGDDFLVGRRVAEYPGELPHGPALLRVRLLSPERALVAERRVRLDIQGALGVTVAITRNCSGVTCPQAGDAPEATECLGGGCVRPECSSLNPGACGSPQCESDGECSPAASCALGRCIEGFCFFAEIPGSCAAGEYCHPERGCTDFAMPDGGPGECVEGASCVVGCESGTTRCTDAGSTCVVDGIAAAGTTCRAAASSCDEAESCDGVSSTCPPDAFVDAGIDCPGGFCDGAGNCSASCVPGAPCGTGNPCERGEIDCAGGTPACTPAGPAAAGTECRAVAGACDVPETCDGASTACPTDTFAGSSMVCRPAVDTCDVAESCDGSRATCPTDAFAPTGTACAAGSCNGLGMCTSGCTPGAPCGTGNPCERGMISCSSGTPACVGAGAATSGTLCRPSAGPCDREETCNGSSTMCPADTFLPTSMVCRGATDTCDVEERCAGTATCPTDDLRPSGYVCRGSRGMCDVQETCTGLSAVCPGDVRQGSGYVCRTSTGECDAAETCDGTSDACPADSGQPDGTPCGTGGCLACGSRVCQPDPLAGSGWVSLASGLTAGGASVSSPAVTVDHLCRPVIAWQENNRAHVRRRDGTSWTPIGGAINPIVGSSDLMYGLRVAHGTRDGELFLLVADYNPSSQVVPFGMQWTGSTWSILGGGAIAPGYMLSFETDLVVDSLGRPIAGWNQDPAPTCCSNTHIYVSRFTSGAWSGFATPINAGTGQLALAPDLDVDGSDAPLVAWQEQNPIHVRRWTGSWANIGTGSVSAGGSSATDACIALDGAGNVVVAWREYDGMASRINVRRWNGSSWATLATALSDGSGGHTSGLEMEVDAADRPVIVWYERTPSSVYVRRWNGSTFAPLGGTLDGVTGSTNAILTEIAIDPLGRPIVVWAEEASSGGTREVYVRRFH